MSKPILGYWDLRGLGEHIRMVLHYAGVDYEDKRYFYGDGPEYDKSDWLNVKHKLGLSFPNLPYWIDGDVKLTESWAILKYIARKYKVLLPPEDQQCLCDMVEGVFIDFKRSFITMCYSENFEKLAEQFFDDLPGKLDEFDKHFGKHEWAGGSKLTYVDFALCEGLNQIELMRPSCFDKHAAVKEYLRKFDNLEKVLSYRNSPQFRRFPITAKKAKWGGHFEK